ncbi:preprotein translocase subunit YajC [Terriglobus aquaticus]|uniref:Sec translocon accessory complex subunit YajC n=1 Tax=Terriglobus aquaticus TaxID=940139 RepID=A0ABW9KQ72_9BACT|nr:preprotein translocase subunit YajC [Terriglobus aquaticus]
MSPFALLLLQASGFGGLSLLLPVVLIGFVLLTAIPQQRKQKAWNEMLTKLKSGDRVTTNGGIRGQIVSLKDDSVIVRVQPDGVKLEFVKSAIASVTTEEDASA